MSTLVTLPDLCLETVLDYLPIENLLRANQIHSRFYLIQKYVLHKRRSLVLFLDNRPGVVEIITRSPLTIPFSVDPKNPRIWTDIFLEQLSYISVYCHQLNCQTINYLNDHFSSVISLQLVHSDVDNTVINQITNLLLRWNTKLTTLKLWLRTANTRLKNKKWLVRIPQHLCRFAYHAIMFSVIQKNRSKKLY